MNNNKNHKEYLNFEKTQFYSDTELLHQSHHLYYIKVILPA